MYAGHFAAALGLKAATPRAPTWALVAGAGALDLAFGTLVIAGREGFAPDYAASHLLDIPWSHSLVTAALLGAGFAACFRAKGRTVMLAVFAAVVSHWLLDLLVHRPDMALWPGSTKRLGYAALFGPVSGWAETLIVLVLTLAYALAARRPAGHGRHWPAVCGLMAVFWLMGRAAG